MINIKNINNLTKIFFLDFVDKYNLFNKKNNKINKKSGIFFLLMILIFCVIYFSYEIISFFIKIHQQEVFLNIFWIGASILTITQLIISCNNIYYYSKDLNKFLHFPIKPLDLLISRFNILVLNTYFTSFIFLAMPMIIYGLVLHLSLSFFINLFVVFIIFPILPALIISLIMSLLTHFSNVIKNKNILIILFIVFFLMLIIYGEGAIINSLLSNSNNLNEINYEQLETQAINFNNKIKNIEKYFIQVDPIIQILNNKDINNIIFNYFKLFLYNIVLFVIFIVWGKKNYLKKLLIINNTVKINKNKEIKRKTKKINRKISSIKKDMKILFRNPLFFTEGIFPIISICATVGIIFYFLRPQIKTIINMNTYQLNYKMDFETIFLILAFIQVLTTFSKISITAISREGKGNAIEKTFPVSYFEQFKIKTILGKIINTFIIIFTLCIIKYIFPKFELIYLLLIFIMASLTNIINNDILVIVDLLNPKINWESEYEVIKNNRNKIFQYFFTILIIVIYKYLGEIFKGVALINTCLCICIILITIAVLINITIKLNERKLFNKIK